MLPTVNEVHLHAKQSIKAMTAFAVSEFGLPADKFVLNVKYDFKPRRTSYAGVKTGKPHMTLKLVEYAKYQVLACNEYARFTLDHVIGGFNTDKWQVHLDSVIAHEISHCVQYYLPLMPLSDAYKKYCQNRIDRGHGPIFKSIYAVFRKKFINDNVTSRIGRKIVNEFEKLTASTTAKEVTPGIIMVGAKFEFRNETYQIIEHNARRYKYPWVAKGLTTNKTYSFATKSIDNYMNVQKVVAKVEVFVNDSIAVSPLLNYRFFDLKTSKVFKVIGYSARSYKYPVKIQCERTGVKYKTNQQYIESCKAA